VNQRWQWILRRKEIEGAGEGKRCSREKVTGVCKSMGDIIQSSDFEVNNHP
jgi:hypothetical protein